MPVPHPMASWSALLTACADLVNGRTDTVMWDVKKCHSKHSLTSVRCRKVVVVGHGGELGVHGSTGVHWKLTWCCLLLQGCGHQAAGDRDIGAAVGTGAVVLPVLCGGLPPAQHPQGLPPTARALHLPQAAPALRAPPGRAQDLSRFLYCTRCRQSRNANYQGLPLRTSFKHQLRYECL